MGDVVISAELFIIFIIGAIVFGMFITSLNKISADSDKKINEFYWQRVVFMAKSIMTQEQLEKLNKMLEEKDEN